MFGNRALGLLVSLSEKNIFSLFFFAKTVRLLHIDNAFLTARQLEKLRQQRRKHSRVPPNRVGGHGDRELFRVGYTLQVSGFRTCFPIILVPKAQISVIDHPRKDRTPRNFDIT